MKKELPAITDPEIRKLNWRNFESSYLLKHYLTKNNFFDDPADRAWVEISLPGQDIVNGFAELKSARRGDSRDLVTHILSLYKAMAEHADTLLEIAEKKGTFAVALTGVKEGVVTHNCLQHNAYVDSRITFFIAPNRGSLRPETELIYPDGRNLGEIIAKADEALTDRDRGLLIADCLEILNGLVQDEVLLLRD